MRGGEEEEEDLFVGALMRTRKIDASTEDAHCALMRVRGALFRQWASGALARACLGALPRPGTSEGCWRVQLSWVALRPGRERCRLYESVLWALLKSGANFVHEFVYLHVAARWARHDGGGAYDCTPPNSTPPPRVLRDRVASTSPHPPGE